MDIFKHKWVKIALGTLLIIITIFLVAGFVLTLCFKPILKDKINNALRRGSDGLYHANFDDASLNLLLGRVVLHHASLIPDTAAFNWQKQLGTAPDKLYHVRVDRLVINNAHLLKLYFKKQLDIGTIVLDAPEIRVAQYPFLTPKNKPKDNRTVYQRMAGSLKMLHIGQIVFSNVKLRYENYTNKQPAVNAFKELDFKATDLLIDSATQFDKSRFLFCREVSVQLHNYRGRAAKALYGYEVKRITYSTRTKQLQINGLSLLPLQTPASFFQKTYSDRFVLRVKSLQFNNFDFETFNKNQTIKASSASLSSGYIQVYSNPRTDPKSFKLDKSITFPNKTVQQLPVKLKIDTLKLSGYEVYYKEYNPKTKRTGYITFNRINGRMYNVTTDSAAIAKNHLWKANLRASFMNRAPMAVNFIFNLKDSLYAYSYRGWAGPLNLQAVNVATVPLSSIKIESGRLKRMDFNIQGNRKQAQGKVTLLYNDLKVQLLKADTASLKMRKLALVSLIANTLILKDNNPDKPDQQPRSVDVIYLRPKNYPFFQTLWRTLLVGIKKCAGLDTKTQRDADLKLSEKEKKEFFKKKKKEAEKKEKAEKDRQKELDKQKKKAREKAEEQQKKANQ
ncbi:hypothetical protein ABDD95_14115 [Mucilaginibacter sp. PAMB04274]|uniref:hypothetical protein n=1 Tax=Mucilaginibacter sp. PAMB04274 TaxID=3138568 RepID=UPI0031F6DBCE